MDHHQKLCKFIKLLENGCYRGLTSIYIPVSKRLVFDFLVHPDSQLRAEHSIIQQELSLDELQGYFLKILNNSLRNGFLEIIRYCEKMDKPVLYLLMNLNHWYSNKITFLTEDVTTITFANKVVDIFRNMNINLRSSSKDPFRTFAKQLLEEPTIKVGNTCAVLENEYDPWILKRILWYRLAFRLQKLHVNYRQTNVVKQLIEKRKEVLYEIARFKLPIVIKEYISIFIPY